MKKNTLTVIKDTIKERMDRHISELCDAIDRAERDIVAKLAEVTEFAHGLVKKGVDGVSDLVSHSVKKARPDYAQQSVYNRVSLIMRGVALLEVAPEETRKLLDNAKSVNEVSLGIGEIGKKEKEERVKVAKAAREAKAKKIKGELRGAQGARKVALTAKLRRLEGGGVRGAPLKDGMTRAVEGAGALIRAAMKDKRFNEVARDVRLRLLCEEIGKVAAEIGVAALARSGLEKGIDAGRRTA